MTDTNVEAQERDKRKCECQIHSCDGGKCVKPDCKVCKVCCEESCPGCKKCKEKDKCLCRLQRCGCTPKNCYGEGEEAGKDVSCKSMESCDRCKTRCGRLGSRCICANCDCGCSYGLCNCCPWCKRNYCTGKCNGYVIGRCPKEGECKGHYTFYGVDGEDVPKKSGEEVLCAYAQDYQNGLCLYKCTACGRLCVKHFCHCVGSVIIAIGAIVFTIFIAWNKYPEKFRRVYYDLRGAFNMAPGHPGRSLTNLVGGRIPDVNVDRYPAFRPRTFAGLS